MRAVVQAIREAYSGLSRPVWILSAASLVNRCGTMVLPFLVLYLTEELGATAEEAGLVLSLYGLGSIGGVALGGRLVDRFGAIHVQAGSLVLSGLVFFVLGAVETLAAAGAVVLLLSLVSEAFRPASAAAIAAFATPQTRVRAYALHRLALNLGMTVGPLLGGQLALRSYHYLFLFDGGTCLGAALVLAWMLAQEADTSRAQDGERGPAASPWRDRLLVASLALVFLMALVFFQLLGTFMLYMKEQRGFDEGTAGMFLATNTVLIVLFEMVLVRKLQGRNLLAVIGFGCLLTGLGYGLLPFGASATWIVFTIVVWTFGEMLTSPLISAFVANRADDRQRGRVMGMMNLAFALAFVLAPMLGTTVYEHVGPDAVWHGCTAVGVVTCAGFLALSRRLRSAGPSP